MIPKTKYCRCGHTSGWSFSDGACCAMSCNDCGMVICDEAVAKEEEERRIGGMFEAVQA